MAVKRSVRFLTAVLLLVLTLPFGCRNEPRNYDDCILKYVKAGMDRAAVSAVMRSCREKFAVESTAHTTKAPRELNRLELLALTGRAGLSFDDHYSGSIYNGNRFVRITEIEITLTTNIGGEKVSRVYRDKVLIPSQTTADFGFDIIVGDKDASYSWSISGAKGVDLPRQPGVLSGEGLFRPGELP